MEYVFNPIYNKSPAGACAKGTAVTYTLQVSRFVQCENVFFVLTDDKDNSVKKIKMPLSSVDGTQYTFKVSIPFKTAGLFWYHFIIENKGHTTFLCKTSLYEVEPSDKAGVSFAQIVYERQCPVDKNYNKGIIYHIFVDRFRKAGTVNRKEGLILRPDWGGDMQKNSHDFLVINRECFGGNLDGIIEKLAYIKSLGTSTIYLSPIFESFSYHKYDTADFENVDTMFGGNEAFARLSAEAKKLGMSILLDGVFNHAGSDSIYFNKLARYPSPGAFQSNKSKYYDWFIFEKFPEKYSCWWGIDTLPKFNEASTGLRNYIAGAEGAIAKHMKSGIVGFRLDVVDEISDIYLDMICARIRTAKPDALILGEVWEDAATKISYDKRRHYFSGKQLNGVMNYPLKNAIADFVTKGKAEAFASTLFMLKDHYPTEVQHNLMNFIGTHDTKRILTVLKESQGKADPIQLLKIASAIQYCAPGVPAVFYGDEAGVQGGDAPFCRVCFPWGKENKEILDWYRKLGKLRGEPLFTNAECNILLAHNGVLIFERVIKTKPAKRKGTRGTGSSTGEDVSRVVLAANCGHEDFKLNLNGSMTNFENGKKVKDSLLLRPFEFVILT